MFKIILLIILNILLYSCIIVPPQASTWILPTDRVFVYNIKQKENKKKELFAYHKVQMQRDILKKQFQSQTK